MILCAPWCGSSECGGVCFCASTNTNDTTSAHICAQIPTRVAPHQNSTHPKHTHADNAHKQKQKHTYTHTRSQTRSGNHSAEHTHTSTTPERDLAHTVTTCATLSKTSPHGLMHTRHKKQCKHYTLVAGSSSANEKKYTGTARAGAFSSSSPMSSSICGVATGTLVAGAFLPSRLFRS